LYMLFDGIYEIDGQYYYFDANGIMKTGWVSIVHEGETYWFFFDGGGTMHMGWLWNGGHWYYMDGGVMLHDGTWEIDGVAYTFDSNGVCTNR